MAEDNKTTAPEGEKTKAQSKAGSMAIFLPGAKIWPGTYKIYRRMRSNPTIALARAAAGAPVRAAKWGVQGTEDTPDEWKAEIHEALKPLWSQLIKDMLRALDYGYAGFEKVFVIDKSGLVTYEKLKALLVDITKILVDKDTGDFQGFKQESVELNPDKSVIYTYDGEAGDLYGRSRNENCRQEWSQYEDLLKKSGQYVSKAAGVIPMIEYPEGKSFNASGVETDNADLAKQMLQNLGLGNGVYMPDTLAQYAQDLARSGVDISQLRAWKIDFLETAGQHGNEITEMMRHMESLMMRGWLVPERTATEGQHGTLAESETHAGLSLTISYLVLLEIVAVINQQIIDPLLVYNHGEDAAGSVFVVPEELGSDEQVFFRKLLTTILSNPQNLDLFLTVLDLDNLLDVAGLPKSDLADIGKAADDAAARADQSGLSPSAMGIVHGIYGAIASRRMGRGLTLE